MLPSKGLSWVELYPPKTYVHAFTPEPGNVTLLAGGSLQM